MAIGPRLHLGAIPVAAGAFARAGITFPPAVGAIAMSISTIVVGLNAMLLRNLGLRPWALARATMRVCEPLARNVPATEKLAASA